MIKNLFIPCFLFFFFSLDRRSYHSFFLFFFSSLVFFPSVLLFFQCLLFFKGYFFFFSLKSVHYTNFTNVSGYSKLNFKWISLVQYPKYLYWYELFVRVWNTSVKKIFYEYTSFSLVMKIPDCGIFILTYYSSECWPLCYVI